MTIRRFNYTGLRKIERKHVRIVLGKDPDGNMQFCAELTLADYKFPGNALVFVEAYRQTTWMRFPWGTVTALLRPIDTKLSDFDSPEGIRFRVRVTATDENHGMMLGEADQISPVGELDDNDERSPLLKVIASDDLGEEVYKVSMDSIPVLMINRRAGDHTALAADPAFQALAGPGILRSVLIHLLIIQGAYDADDLESPHARWLRFAQSIPGVSEYREKNSEETLIWIDDAVRAFTAQKNFMATFLNHWQKGGFA